MKKIFLSISAIAALVLAGDTAKAQFTTGNLVVLQANGTTSAATSISLMEYNTFTPNQTTTISSVNLPSTSTTSPNATVSGSAGTDGMSTLDAERTHLIVAAYDATASTAGISSLGGVNRSIFSVQHSGAYSAVADVPQLTGTTDSCFYTQNFKSATASGTNYFGVGGKTTGTTCSGVQLMGGSIHTQVSNTVELIRIAQIFNGQLYFSSSAATTPGIYTVGTGIPTSAGTTSNLLATSGGTGISPFGFAISPDNNTLYVADNTIGIQKFTRTGGTGTFVFAYTLTAVGYRALVVDFSTTPYSLYATTEAATTNSIVKIVDAGATSTSINLATAPTGTIFKGLTFVPGAYATIAGGGDTICSGGSQNLVFYGNPGATVSYQINGGTIHTVNLDNTGTYTLNTGALINTNANDSVFTYSLVNVVTSLGTTTITGSTTIRVCPNSVAPITGANTACMGTPLSLNDVSTGGTWTSSSTGTAIVSAAGVVSPVAPGVTIITYSRTNVCGTHVDTQSVTVIGAPVSGTITGASTLCASATTTLTESVTGGTWSSSASTLATVDASGHVTGVAGGSVTISYTVTNSCGSNVATHTMTISPLPDPGVISGPSGVCVGSPITLAETVGGGTWGSTNTTIATVDAGGHVNGLTSGIDTITYSLTNTCGTSTYRFPINVSSSPVGGTISGASTACTGVPVTLTETLSGGAWTSSATGIATVDASGHVTGVAVGSVTITYTMTYSCGTATATHAMTISLSPSAGTISGASSVCLGTPITLTCTGTGGTWSSVTTSLATVDASGHVTGVASGVDTIKYSVTNSCGTAVAVHPVTVATTPSAGTISGPTAVCTGTAIALSETIAGGTWASSSTATATVAAGVVTAGAVGSTIISYTVTNPCGSATDTQMVSVLTTPVAGVISGGPSVCMGATLSLSESVTGGVWTSGTTTVATISGSGTVTPVAAGSTTVSYAVTNLCSTAYATLVVNVETPAGTITGPDTVCQTASIILASNPAGGTWSSSNASIATASAAGSVTGVAPGTVTISYSLTNSCGTTTSSFPMTVFSTGYCDSMTAVPTVVGQANQVSVYPNPATGSFNILVSSAFNEQATITISNLMGQKVKEMAVMTNVEAIVNLGNASGVYMIRIHSAHGDLESKISVIE